ncbi:hypothetical protein C6N75_02985 [Streptomyces solincola]|uniref:Peptidase C58 YopT-type domain-containing protein n=2 Tax=Streptomyces solincola TaxID=2100817 RepID=A0A2S9Q212_9ACTN|nr:hypothetical protein C6N75_02985 [Streptomyces solincola]
MSVRLPKGLPGMCYLTAYSALRTLGGYATVPLVPLGATRMEYEDIATQEGRTARLGRPVIADSSIQQIAKRLSREKRGTMYEIRAWDESGGHAALAYRDPRSGDVVFADPENVFHSDAAHMTRFWSEMGYSHFAAWRFGTMARR